MSEENSATVETDGNDTAAVLAAASGDKTYVRGPGEPAPDPAAEPEPKEDETSGNDAPAAAEPSEAEKPRKKTAQERIDEITAQKHEAAREAEFWKAKALQTQSPQPAQEAPQHQPEGDGRPAREDYQDDFEFIEALTDWKAVQAAKMLVMHQRQQEQVSSARSNFETRTKALFPDGETAGLAAFRALPTLPQAVLEIVGESEIGPKIADHLGANPAEFARLETLSPIQQARELTRLETRLTTPAAASKPPPKTATDAPEPPPQARGAGGQFKVAADTDDFAAFEKQYRVGG
jgi:hypothetical protein